MKFYRPLELVGIYVEIKVLSVLDSPFLSILVEKVFFGV